MPDNVTFCFSGMRGAHRTSACIYLWLPSASFTKDAIYTAAI